MIWTSLRASYNHPTKNPTTSPANVTVPRSPAARHCKCAVLSACVVLRVSCSLLFQIAEKDKSQVTTWLGRLVVVRTAPPLTPRHGGHREELAGRTHSEYKWRAAAVSVCTSHVILRAEGDPRRYQDSGRQTS